MELREGYKQTEVGVIPKDWDVITLEEIGHFKNGINKDAASFGYGSPFVNLLDVFENVELSANNKFDYLECNDKEKNIYDLIEGDVLFVRSSVKPTGVGLTAVISENLKEVVFSGFLIRFRDNKKIDTDFKKYCFYEQGFRKRLISVSSSSANTNINQDNLKRLNVILPSSNVEQSRIAKALSDADAWILSLTKLIEKKRLIKQGAMQTLLNPYENGRLKDGWKLQELNNSATLKARIGWQGLTTSEYLSSGEFYLVTGTDFKNGAIDWENCHYVDKYRFEQDKYIQLKNHDILITKDGTIGKVAYIDLIKKPATLNSGVFVIRPIRDSFHALFFYYILRSKIFKSFLAQLTAGSTINHLYQKDFVKFSYLVPKKIDEQIRLATILFEMDKEISELEKKLAKAKQIKQGMMQQLLTGSIRLV